MKQTKKRPRLVAIFAHPDDECFGPGGTLYKYSKTHDVYIICATKGEAGGSRKKIAQIRAKEMQKSAKILGAKSVAFLGFKDATLSNSIYHKIGSKIEEKLNKLKPEILITFEPRGVSSHIDHITISMVTTYVFKKSKFAKTLMYFCLSQEKRSRFSDDYFIYFPPGYSKDQIDRTVDVSDVWQTKVKAMKVHKSQMADTSRVLRAIEKDPKEEHFIILAK